MTLPGLVPQIAVDPEPDIRLNLGNSPSLEWGAQRVREALKYESAYKNESGQPVLRIWELLPGDYMRLAYCDGTEFWLDSTGQSVWASWPETSSLQNTASYLFGPVLGLLLRLRGVICLHASAVNLHDRCIAFMGSEGAGKSTTAAAFVQRGYAALSDDIVALDEPETGFRVLPAYPHLSLWPDSVKTLYGSSEALPRFTPDWEKRRLALGSHETRFENRALPLAAIYLLGDRGVDSSPVIGAVSQQEALLAMVVHSYATNILDRTMRAREFAVLGRLASRVPVRRIITRQDPSLIGELCQVVVDDVYKLIRARSNVAP